MTEVHRVPDSTLERELWEAERIFVRDHDGSDGRRGGLALSDPLLYGAIESERKRLQSTIELIASENYASTDVLEAQGSVLTNKYAEGYPGKRYYGGCEYVDVAESLAIERACALFDAEHANVQPHSGSQANAAVYLALVRPGESVLAMDLAHGGHLTHGHKINYSGLFYSVHHYGVDRQSERIDYDLVRAMALRHEPRLLFAGGSSYSRFIDFSRLREIADEVGATFVVDMAHVAGLVAAGVHPSPIPHAHVVTTTTHKTLRGPRGGLILCTKELARKIDRAVFPGIQGGPLMHTIAAKAVALREAMSAAFARYARRVVENAAVLSTALQEEGLRIVSGGTDNHLMCVDLRGTGLTGREASWMLEDAGIAVNKNQIPYDPQPPMVTSGIRLGTPAVTTRGMGAAEMTDIARLIGRVLRASGEESVLCAVREEVLALCERFRLPMRG